MQQPLSEMSYTHRNFFGFVPPPSFGGTQASTNKKCYSYEERGHLTHQCPLALNCLGNSTLAESSRTTLEDVTPPTTTTTAWEALPRYKTIIKQRQ
jgi:hypothetical protein